MNCEEAELLLESLHDDNLEPRLKTRVERHLADCPSCGGIMKGLQNMRGVIRKGFIPPPSASLDRIVMREIRRAGALRRPQKTTWWQRMFGGSVKIPKPAFAAALIMIAVGLILSNLPGRNAANFSASPDALNSPSALAISLPKRDEPEKTKIVEVPVIRERVVKQTIYVERPNLDSRKDGRQYSALRPNKRDFETLQKESPVRKRNVPDLEMKDSIAENGYFTRVNLSGFKPAVDAKTRIIKEGKVNEK